MKRFGALIAALLALSAGAAPIAVTPTGDPSGAGDTAAILSAFGSVGADTTGDTREVNFCGHYTVNALLPLVFNHSPAGQGPLRIHGCAQSTITQLGNNVGIFELQVPDNATPHDVTIDGLTLTYAAQQTCTADPASVAIGMRDTVSPAPAGANLFAVYFQWLTLSGACRGIANTQIAGGFPVWMIDITRVTFGSMAGAAVWLVSPSSIGQPNIALNGPNYVTCSGGTDPIVRIDGADSLTIRNLEVNACDDRSVAYVSGAISYSLMASKIETGTYTQNTNPILRFENAMGSVDGFLASNLTLSASNLVLMSTGAGNSGQSNTARNLTISVKQGTGTINFVASSAQRLYLLDAPHVWSTGSGPAKVQLLDNQGSTSANFVSLRVQPGGEMGDDVGDADLSVGGLTTPAVSIYNTPLTAPRSIILSTGVATNMLWDGAEFEFIRSATATGAALSFVGLSIPSTASIPPGASVKVRYRRSLGWVAVTPLNVLPFIGGATVH